MVGGAAEHFERVRPMLDVMGQNIHLVGPTGAGATIKLVNQMMNLINACGAVEGLILATKAGIDPELAYEILRTSSGASRSLDNVATNGLTRNFEPGFTADLMHKDVSLAVALGRAAWGAAARRGAGRADHPGGARRRLRPEDVHRAAAGAGEAGRRRGHEAAE